MAVFSVIEGSEAPAASRTSGRLAARMSEYESFVASVKKGQVGKLSPTAGEGARSLVLRISRAGTRVGKPVDAWAVDGVVYFKPQ